MVVTPVPPTCFDPDPIRERAAQTISEEPLAFLTRAWLETMSRLRLLRIFPMLLVLGIAPAGAGEPLQRIAFGSCAKQDQPQPIWNAVLDARPQLFLFLGDNIYGDTEDMALLKRKWDLLGAQPGYQRLRAACPILATWDDHDMGKNDAGADYPRRRESQGIFLDFFGVPANSPRRQREGVYHAESFGEPGRRVRVILLDARYFRAPLQRGYQTGEPGEGRRGRYLPTEDPAATVLGEAQWRWLEEQLREPAELRLLCSGAQIIPDEHGWETWGNFPRERARLFRLIRDTRAGGVVLLSGDRHFAEMTRLSPGPDGPRYPLYEITSSSLNRPSGNMTKAGTRFANELNSFRVGLAYFETNFGMIEIDWAAPDPVVRLQVRDEQGGVVLQRRVALSEIHPSAGQNADNRER